MGIVGTTIVPYERVPLAGGAVCDFQVARGVYRLSGGSSFNRTEHAKKGPPRFHGEGQKEDG